MRIDSRFEVRRSNELSDLLVGDETDLEIRVRVVGHEQEVVDVTGFSNSPRALSETLGGEERLTLMVTSIKRPV